MGKVLCIDHKAEPWSGAPESFRTVEEYGAGIYFWMIMPNCLKIQISLLQVAHAMGRKCDRRERTPVDKCKEILGALKEDHCFPIRLEGDYDNAGYADLFTLQADESFDDSPASGFLMLRKSVLRKALSECLRDGMNCFMMFGVLAGIVSTFQKRQEGTDIRGGWLSEDEACQKLNLTRSVFTRYRDWLVKKEIIYYRPGSKGIPSMYAEADDENFWELLKGNTKYGRAQKEWKPRGYRARVQEEENNVEFMTRFLQAHKAELQEMRLIEEW